jgi:putative acetyltransferase
MEIIEARQADIEAVRELFRAYAASLPFSLEFQGFAAELAGLPKPYAPPRGCLLLACHDGAAVGIVGLRPLAAGMAEVKRLYVVPQARGAGLGRQLAQRIIAEARAKGYARLRLDTHRASMAGAIRLYEALGFVEIPAYGANPGGEFAFFENRL